MYEVISVQYSALCENEKNEKNQQYPNPAQQELLMLLLLIHTFSVLSLQLKKLR